MEAKILVDALGADFYAGVPDSQLKALCAHLMARYGTDPAHHVIAANEGGCVGLAAGYHMATGKVPVVYMQNSGQGNAVNPITSLTSADVYAIPVIYVIGWRGEPGVRDEPQHVQQGRVTLDLLDVLGIRYFVLGRETTEGELRAAVDDLRCDLEKRQSVAIVVRKGALSCEDEVEYGNGYAMARERVVELVSRAAGSDLIVSTTGKASRELFEAREARGEGHGGDFLVVGSMGHASSIALGIAVQKPGRRIWCLDGDGAVLMHMGALAIIGECAPSNLVHVVMNNEAHESVGGMPTAAKGVDLPGLARACGYRGALTASTEEELAAALEEVRLAEGPVMLEVKCSVGSRPDLGRPTTSPLQNKAAFMRRLGGTECVA
ncbi:phosphonopyruvate decarboxylase [Adlercreutzia sp. ZJ242]|uniref:phosphonopyruvate decarboxylase n=1 Tax=Adlercreutzia sp. ZJ242 TaxID=2709409 RepID=UPI0013ED83B8|nr:phosphonopyruvate decarboxylase [Adlercreutzia sp. ZJ242]